MIQNGNVLIVMFKLELDANCKVLLMKKQTLNIFSMSLNMFVWQKTQANGLSHIYTVNVFTAPKYVIPEQ